MTALWIGLLVALGPTMWFDWNLRAYGEEPDLRGLEATSARCLYDPQVAAETSKWRLCEKYALPNVSYAAAKDCMDEQLWQSRWPSTGLSHEVLASDEFTPAMFSIFLTTLTFFIRLAKIFGPLSRFVRSAVRKRLSGWLLRRMIKTAERPSGSRKCSQIWREIYLRLQISFYLVSSAYVDLVSSEVSDVSS